MTSSLRRTAGTALFIAVGVSPAAGQLRVLVTSIGYQSPSLVAPVVVMSFMSASGSGIWTVGVAGYTLSVARTSNQGPTLATVVTADVTPLNSNSSNYVYRGGVRDSALAFHDATVQLTAGVRVVGGDKRSSTSLELRAIGLDESVSRLADATVVARWKDPYVGLGIDATYGRVVSEEILAARWDGVRAAAKVAGFVGAGGLAWWKSHAWLGAGKRVGRVSLMGRVWVLLGGNLDVVNRHLVGGSWDVAGSPALYGYHYAEFRVDRGAVGSASVDLRLAGTWSLGLRAGYLTSPSRSTYGEAMRVSTVWSGIGFHIGVGWPRAGSAIVFAGVSAAVLL